MHTPPVLPLPFPLPRLSIIYLLLLLFRWGEGRKRSLSAPFLTNLNSSRLLSRLPLFSRLAFCLTERQEDVKQIVWTEIHPVDFTTGLNSLYAWTQYFHDDNNMRAKLLKDSRGLMEGDLFEERPNIHYSRVPRPHHFVTRDGGNQRLIYKPETGDKTPPRKGWKEGEGGRV